MIVKQAHFGVQVDVHKAEVHSYDLPKLKPDELLLKIEICNICTTDYQRFNGQRNCELPMADGHEFCGIIVDKGNSVQAELNIGDRVGKLNRYCGICEDCLRGDTGNCLNIGEYPVDEYNYHGFKAFANYKIIPQRLAIKISNEIPATEAAFLEPVMTAVHAVKKARIRPMEIVVVIGAGTMGIVNAQVAHAFGAKTYITDISNKKVERAKKMNIGPVFNSAIENSVERIMDLTNGRGADTVIVTVPVSSAYQQAYDMVRHFDGKIVFFPAGYPKPKFDFDPNDLHYRKMEFIGTVDGDTVDFVDAARLLSQRLIHMNFQLALETACIPDSYRVSVDCQQI